MSESFSWQEYTQENYDLAEDLLKDPSTWELADKGAPETNEDHEVKEEIVSTEMDKWVADPEHHWVTSTVEEQLEWDADIKAAFDSDLPFDHAMGMTLAGI